MEDWSEQAERLHGVTPRMLADLGVDPARACDRLSSALAGLNVYSDAPDWDSFWMMRLYKSVGRHCDIRLLDFAAAIPPLTQAEKLALLQQADRLAPRRHRAAEDAIHLQTVYRLARGL
jgi:hypothetical protein